MINWGIHVALTAAPGSPGGPGSPGKPTGPCRQISTRRLSSTQIFDIVSTTTLAGRQLYREVWHSVSAADNLNNASVMTVCVCVRQCSWHTGLPLGPSSPGGPRAPAGPAAPGRPVSPFSPVSPLEPWGNTHHRLITMRTTWRPWW